MTSCENVWFYTSKFGYIHLSLRIAKQRVRENRDIIGVPCIQDENGNSKTEIGEDYKCGKDIARGW